jgi:hypothetical protein
MKIKALFVIGLVILTMWTINFGMSSNFVQHANALGSRTPDNDNSFGTATEISAPGIYNGTLNGGDDIFDFYKINLSANSTSGDTLNVNYTIKEVSGMGSVSILNPEKYRIAFGMCWIGYIPFVNLTICPSYAGYYYIAVVGLGVSDEKYSINVTWKSENRTIDSDNTNATAQTAINGGSYNDDIDPVYDYLDLYQIYLTSGSTTTEGLIVELDNYLDKTIDVYNPDGSLRDYSDIISSTNQSTKEIVRIAADQTGFYTIAVSSSHGFSSQPTPQDYFLNCTIVTGIPPDTDYDRDHALLVYDGTEINTSFNSSFDKHDFYMMDLNTNDNLTVSIYFKDGSGSINIDIQDDIGFPINFNSFGDSSKGEWTWGIAQETIRHYIDVETYSYMGNYTILFSLTGDNLWNRDYPMIKNNINKDFSMMEDTEDLSHVNLNDIFFDPDSEMIFDSPSHPSGSGENINIQILTNGSVKFMPKQDFDGFEVVNFSSQDIKSNFLYWEVNVTVININDAPQVSEITHQVWKEDEEVNFTIPINDADNTEFIITSNSTLFESVNETGRLIFTPTNEQVGFHYIQLDVSDGEYKSIENFTVEVQNTNDPPKIDSVDNKPAVINGTIELQAIEDKWYNFIVIASDIDHDVGETDVLDFYTDIKDPSFSIDSSTGQASFLPLQKHVGTFDIKIIVNDGKGGIGHQNISISVDNVNDIPSKPNIVVNDVRDLTVNCSAEDTTDEDGDELVYTWDFGDGTSPETGEFCVHTYNEGGIYNVTVSASDGNGGISSTYKILNLTLPPDDDTTDDVTDDQTTEDKINDTTTDDNVTDDDKIILPIRNATTDGKESLQDKWWFYPVIGSVIILIIILLVVASIFMRAKKRKEEELLAEEEAQAAAAAPPPPVEAQGPPQPVTAEDLYGQDTVSVPAPAPAAPTPEPVQPPGQEGMLDGPSPAPEIELEMEENPFLVEQFKEEGPEPQQPSELGTGEAQEQLEPITDQVPTTPVAGLQANLCENCGSELSFIEQYNQYYCNNCQSYR